MVCVYTLSVLQHGVGVGHMLHPNSGEGVDQSTSISSTLYGG